MAQYLPGNKHLRKCESIGWLSIEEMWYHSWKMVQCQSPLIEALLDGDVASLTKQSAVDLLWTRTLNQMSQSIWETWPWSFPMHKQTNGTYYNCENQTLVLGNIVCSYRHYEKFLQLSSVKLVLSQLFPMHAGSQYHPSCSNLVIHHAKKKSCDPNYLACVIQSSALRVITLESKIFMASPAVNSSQLATSKTKVSFS